MIQRLISIAVLVICSTALSVAQTVSTVKSAKEKFKEGSGPVMLGKITVFDNTQNDETEYKR
jgi:hypothetical protein